MTTTLSAVRDRLRLEHLPSVPRLRLSLEEVAEISDHAILNMASEELACVIRSVRGANLRPDVEESLELYDLPTLRRLAFLTRRSCRQQLATAAHIRVCAGRDQSGDWAFGSVECQAPEPTAESAGIAAYGR